MSDSKETPAPETPAPEALAPRTPAPKTQDRFMRGRFEAIQPKGSGHRSGSDALLLSACLPLEAEGRLADLGAGAGVAGLAAATLNPKLRVALVEIDETMHSLARESLDLFANESLSERVELIQADITLSGKRRESQGLESEAFDYVIMNPPYNHDGLQPSPDRLRSLARSAERGGLEAWMKTACAILKPSGTLCMIYRTERLADALCAAKGRFGGVAILPVHDKQGHSARRILIRAERGSRAPVRMAPALILRDLGNQLTPLAEKLFDGEERISFADS